MNSSIYVSAILVREGRILLIEEESLNGRLYYNLPYVKIGQHERLDEAIQGEIRGKIGIECAIESLLGIYTGFPVRNLLCFMFKAGYKETRDLVEPRATWMKAEEIEGIPNEDILNSTIVRTAMADYASGTDYDLGIIKDLMYGKGLKR